MLKISVVIPAYRSGAGLDRLIASLDAQTLPTSEYEVIFVDDGSPDDTYARLISLQSTRPHVRVERIENSGWPSRPRNVGTDLALGEYVAYMDHDDELYPDALRAAYEFARANGADVVSGKEARTHDAAWAVDLYRADVGQAVGRADLHPLIPMNPHKLYRRQFLIDHGIRFPEGGRVMWEDIFFNMQVARHARVISVLASVPYYHWFTTRGSGSTGFTRSSPDFWVWLRRLFEATGRDLGDDELAYRQLMTHQYRSRLVGSFDTRFAGRPHRERDLIYRHCHQLQRDFDLERFDRYLNSSGRMRADLLRTDQRALLESLPAADPAIPGRGTAQSLRWDGDVLHVSARVDWSTAAGRRHALRRTAGGRLVKILPDALEAALPEELRDMTDEVRDASVELGMRSRESRIVWMLPSIGVVTVADTDASGVRISGTLEARLDLRTAVFGRPAVDDVWDLNVRTTLGGTVSQQALRGSGAATVSMTPDVMHMAFVNGDGFVTVLRDARVEVLRRLRPVDVEALSGDRVTVTLEGVHAGDGATTVRIGLDMPSTSAPRFVDVDADLAVRDGRATVTFRAPARTFRMRIGDRGSGARQWWTVNGDDLHPGPIAERPRERKHRFAGIRRRVGRALRRWGLRR